MYDNDHDHDFEFEFEFEQKLKLERERNFEIDIELTDKEYELINRAVGIYFEKIKNEKIKNLKKEINEFDHSRFMSEALNNDLDRVQSEYLSKFFSSSSKIRIDDVFNLKEVLSVASKKNKQLKDIYENIISKIDCFLEQYYDDDYD